MRRKALLVVVLAVVAGAPAVAGADEDSLVGGWRSIDYDGSSLAWFIEESVDGTYLVEAYDHAASTCGGPGSRTPGAPPGGPVEPARYGLGYAWIDGTGALALNNADIVCLDAVLGPYRLMSSDFNPDIPEEEDTPLLGPMRLSYEPTTDSLIDANAGPDFEPLVFERMKAETVEEFRKELEDPNR